MNEDVYKVLWIDDDTNIVDDYQRRAEKHHLDLIHFTNWEEARVELEHKFEEYSAIILDAFCKRGPNDIVSENFLIQAIGQIKDLMGRKQRDIPWYILSAGTMDNYKLIVGGVEGLRGNLEEWGSMEYSKFANDGDKNHIDILFENILRVAKQKGLNIALNRHATMFSYLGEGKLIRYEARKLMLRMLSALYFPEENVNFQYEANPLRKVLEYIFRSARDKGLVPDECFENDGSIHLNDASRYMSGINTRNSGGVRYGKAGNGREGRGGDAIFPLEMTQIVWSILTYSNAGSHTEDVPKDEPYVVSEDNKELFFGYVLQLCHIIKWFGKYVEGHPDQEANSSMKRHAEDNNATTDEPKTNKPKKLDKKEFVSAKVSREDVVGKDYPVINMGDFWSAGSCKLSAECKEQVRIGTKVRIVDLEENRGKNNARYPYIATEIRIIE